MNKEVKLISRCFRCDCCNVGFSIRILSKIPSETWLKSIIRCPVCLTSDSRKFREGEEIYEYITA